MLLPVGQRLRQIGIEWGIGQGIEYRYLASMMRLRSSWKLLLSSGSI